MGITGGKKAAMWLIAAAVFCTMVAASATTALAYSITGYVTKAVGGAAVQGAELQVWQYSEASSSWIRPGIYAESGSDGSYTLSFYDTGKYRVQCYNVDGYYEQWWDLAATPNAATTLTVPGSTLTDIDFHLNAIAAPKKMTAITMRAPATCAYRSAVVTGTLTSEGLAMSGRQVVLERYSGGIWKPVATKPSTSSGYYAFVATPTVVTRYRVRFAGDSTYAECASSSKVVWPRVSLTVPTAPSTAHKTTYFTSVAYLKPKHAAGTYPVLVRCQHKESGIWVTRRTYLMKASNYSTFTKVVKRFRLSLKGSWRIRAEHAKDSLNAATLTAWRPITIR